MRDLPAGTHTVAVVAADRHGVLRGKHVPADRWPEVRDRGLAIAGAILHWTAQADLPPELGCTADGVPDVRLVPVPGGVRPSARRGEAVALCEPRSADGTDLPRSARAALRRVLAAASARGLEPRIGFEVEFCLLDATTRRPAGRSLGCYDVAGAGDRDAVLSDLRQRLDALGIAVEAWNAECGPGQVEVNLAYDEALVTADRAVLFRNAVRQAAAAHGRLATFMPLPWDDGPGNGLHLHHSLWSGGRNAFAGEGGDLSRTGRHYLAGLQSALIGLTLLGSPSPNALKRRRDHSFCPVTDAWAYDNRTVALRVLRGSPDAVRIEQRDAASDADPYLVMAAQVAAGLDGVARELVPRPPAEGDAYATGAGTRLPDNVPDAVAALRASDLAAGTFAPELLDVVACGARFEHDLLLRQVSELERDRYLGAR